MRIRRIALRHFRGVADAQVQLATCGVTVVEGPNEVGKSSLAEALDLLFDQPDSSTRAAVKAVKPVHLDAGAEVEVELTSGGYHVVYAKRWHNQPRTTLRVLAPEPESLTGRAAHDRMRQILAGTLDEALWRALRYQQGTAISQAALGESQSLAAALDAAASGGLRPGTEESDLWERVGRERARYTTPTGRPNAERVRLAEELDRVRARVEELRREVAALEAAAERHRRLGVELVETAARLADQRRLLDEHTASWQGLQARQRALAELETSATVAAAQLEAAEHAAAERRRLVEELRAAGEELDRLGALAQRDTPGLHAARAAQEQARAQRDAARSARRRAEQASEVAAADHSYFRDLLGLELLEERYARVQQAERQHGEASDFLAGCPIDADTLARLEAAFLAAAEARARLGADGPEVHVQALPAAAPAGVAVELAGEPRVLAPGEEMTAAVVGRLELVFPGLARVAVTSGAATREDQAALEAAEAHLAGLSAAVGVAGPDALAQARWLEQRRRFAQRDQQQAAQALQENLRDLTPQLMSEKIERTRARLRDYLQQRQAPAPLPAGRDDAAERNEAAAGQLAEARRAEEAREEDLERAEAELARVQQQATARGVELELARQRCAAAEQALAAARALAGDEALEQGLAAARERARRARQDWQQAAASLAAADPEGARVLVDNAGQVLERTGAAHRALEIELAEVRSLLEVTGEAGLHDQLDAAESELARLEREKEQLDRRAAAAELLYERLAHHRDAAKRAYVTPFREQLERLGRVVFGPSLQVGLDHESLHIRSRTLEGVTVAYESLSTGAREQLCLIARLAGALLVSPGTPAGDPGAGDPDAGVPVIIDDALGYSDQSRLERLGAVLAVAGRHTQVIVLTCVPERYRNVGGATVVRLQPRPPAAGQP